MTTSEDARWSRLNDLVSCLTIRSRRCNYFEINLKLTNISKSYAGGLANKRVNLTIKPQEIQALLEENGAGKSTLMKSVYGLVRSDAGQIEWEGQQVNISSPEQARSLGINMVFQHFSLFETLTVTENIALAQPKHEKWNLARLAHKIRQLSDLYSLSVDPNRPIHLISVGERQQVEIIPCLRQTTKLLILDEPTAVLTPQETEKLFSTLLNSRSQLGRRRECYSQYSRSFDRSA